MQTLTSLGSFLSARRLVVACMLFLLFDVGNIEGDTSVHPFALDFEVVDRWLSKLTA